MRTGVICEIERAENGICVCVDDPVIRKANAKPNAKWQDPEKEYVFPSLDKALKWVKENADKLSPMEDEGPASQFTSAWNEAKTKD
jgi:hypothetical protein